MAKKYIVVTEGNRDALTAQYDEEEDFLEGCEGLYLVADFAVEDHFELLTKENFDAAYLPGAEIDNGYREAIRK